MNDVSIGQAVGYLDLDTSRFKQGFRSAMGDLKVFKSESATASDKLNGVSNALGGVGTSLTKGVTLPILGAGAAALKMSVDFDKGVKKFSTVMDTGIVSVKDMSKSVLSLSDDVNVSTDDLNNALYEVLSATNDTANAMGYLKVAAKLAKGGFTETAVAVDGATSVMNAYGQSGEKAFQKIADVMIVTQNVGKTTVDQLAKSLFNVIPTAASLGISFEEVSAGLAAITAQGTPTSVATTQLRQLFVELSKAGGDAAVAFEQLSGKTFKNFIKGGGSISDALAIMQKGAKQSKVELSDMFSSVEAGNAALQLTGVGADKFKGSLDAINKSAGATDTAFKTMTTSAKEGFQEVLNKLKNIGIELGTIIMPTILKIAEGIKSLLDRFAKLNDNTKKTIVTIAGIAAVAGPVLIVLGKVVGAISTIVGACSTLGTAIAGVGAASTAAGAAGATAAGAAAGPIGWIILAVAALVAGTILLVNHFKKQAIPAVQLFGKETSDSTKKAVGAYVDLDKKASLSLTNLKFSSSKISKETANTLISNFDEMGKQIKSGMDKNFSDSYASLSDFFVKSQALTASEEQKILANMKTNTETRKNSIDVSNAQIKEILNKASSEKRALNENEQSAIEAIQQNMKFTAVRVLSETEVESRAILERMYQQSGEITALQAVEVTKNSLTQKNEAVKNATAQYDETVKAIIRQRDETGAISATQADTLIKDAQRTKDGAVESATEMHNKIVEQAKLQAGEQAEHIDWGNAQVKTKWQEFKEFWVEWWNELCEQWKTGWNDIVLFFTESIPKFFEDIKLWFQKLPENLGILLGQLIADLMLWFYNLGMWFETELPKLIEKIANFWWTLPGKIGAAFMSVVNTIAKWGLDMAASIGVELPKIIDNITNWFKELPKNLLNIGKDMISNLWDGIWSKFDWLKEKMGEFFGGLGKGFRGSFDLSDYDTSTSNREGLDYVPYDGYRATLHKGEKVSTAQEVKESKRSEGGDTFIFNSPKVIDEREAARRVKRVKQELSYDF